MTEKIVESINREPTVGDARPKRRMWLDRGSQPWFFNVYSGRNWAGEPHFARKRSGIRVAAYRKKT